MIIAFRCSRTTKAQIDALVAAGDYMDYGELISVAVNNLDAVHRQFDDVPASKIETGNLPLPDDVATGKGISKSIKAANSTSATKIPEKPPTQSVDAREIVPALFSANGIDKPPIVLLPQSAASVADQREFTLDEWVFGQFNKLLPAKASCRGLAHLMAAEGGPVNLSKSAQQIASEAQRLGRCLKSVDQSLGNLRDDAISIPQHSPQGTAIQPRRVSDSQTSSLDLRTRRGLFRACSYRSN